jgi:hypothetical protein
MRFRLLSNEELSHLDTEFKQFLIVNHIHAEDWLKINEREPEKSLALVELFSDTVLLKVYEKIQFLEFREQSLFSVYKISEDKVQAIHIKSENESISLETDVKISVALKSYLSDLNVYKAEKKVQPFKEDEIHRLIQQGCLVSNEFVWSQMMDLLVNT